MNSKHPFRLDGKTILVSGASSGLGRQTAISCSHMGAKLFITGRDSERLAVTRAELSGDGHRAAVADLTLADDINRLVDECGKIDGVFHGAGVRGLAPIKQISEKFVQHVFASNYFAPMLLTQRLLSKRSIQQGGSIVFMSSTAAHLGVHGVGVYSGTKAALLASMRCLANEQGRNNIRANCLSPDLVETPMVVTIDTVDTKEWIEMQRNRHPLGLGAPEDVANAAIYLLSDASRWVTGTTLIMDGGVTF
jgi:NAD(P)-dependent dehydrogenase (short-subunit alcohol dehydrogenase family)